MFEHYHALAHKLGQQERQTEQYALVGIHLPLSVQS